MRDIKRNLAAGSRSAKWYSTTMKNTTPLPDNLNKSERKAIYRLRLGYKSFAEIKENTPVECEHCHARTDLPLIHYLTECRKTEPYLNRDLGTPPEIIEKNPHKDLTKLIKTFPPPN